MRFNVFDNSDILKIPNFFFYISIATTLLKPTIKYDIIADMVLKTHRSGEEMVPLSTLYQLRVVGFISENFVPNN